MRHDQHITHPMTYPMTDPQMKTKTMNMTMNKTRVQNCDVRAVSHSCDVFIFAFVKETSSVVKISNIVGLGHRFFCRYLKDSSKKSKNSGSRYQADSTEI